MIGNGHAGFGRAASEKDPQGHLAGVVPRHAAIPARSRRNGPGNGFAKRCAHGERATALRRPPTTGRARTHADAAAKRSNDYRPENGPRRPLSSICTGAGRRPSRTPSAAPERSGVNAVDIRTRAGAWPSVNGSAEGRRDASAIASVGEARRREPAVVCQQPSVVRSPQFGDRRRSRPRGRRDYRNRGKAITRPRRVARVLAGDCDHPAIRGAVITFMVERSPRPVGSPDKTDRQRVAAHTTARSAPATVKLAASGLVLAG